MVTQNISWLYPAQQDEIEIDVLMERAASYQHHFQNVPRRSVIEVVKQLNTAYQQSIGNHYWILGSYWLSAVSCSTF
ncbi:TPA: TnsA endonuclease C-terminal domain-containing protein [Serratia marcescens]